MTLTDNQQQALIKEIGEKRFNEIVNLESEPTPVPPKINLFKLGGVGGEETRLFTPKQFKDARLPDTCIQVRCEREYSGIAFYLNKYEIKAKLKEDSGGVLCLVIERRDGE